jgi:hypothetical protein
MRRSKHNYYLVLAIICSITLFSCRKKDNRYEGNYIGTERHTYLDSGTTVYSLDTTYAQEVQVTYSNALNSKNKYYSFSKISGTQDQFTVTKKSIVDDEYLEWNSNGYIKFSGDSMYIYSSGFDDQAENWDTETWEFKGKRN